MVLRGRMLCVLLTLWIGVAGTVATGTVSLSVEPQQQEEFVPVEELEPEAQLPAAPLLVAAYAFAWLAIFVYLWSIWRRLAHVERELGDVARRMAKR